MRLPATKIKEAILHPDKLGRQESAKERDDFLERKPAPFLRTEKPERAVPLRERK